MTVSPPPRPARRGARILRTGVAMVHRGEVVLPAAGSEVQAEQVLDDERTVVTYHFPVEVEVRGPAPAPDLDDLAETVFARLVRGLDGLT